jgi:hypothetical protein
MVGVMTTLGTQITALSAAAKPANTKNTTDAVRPLKQNITCSPPPIWYLTLKSELVH